MAKEYLEKLSDLICALRIRDKVDFPMETNHFFSGAALYVNETMCVSWSPVGLEFKLPEQEVQRLIMRGKVKPLKYFPEGHVKKGYALFENPSDKKHINGKNTSSQQLRSCNVRQHMTRVPAGWFAFHTNFIVHRE